MSFSVVPVHTVSSGRVPTLVVLAIEVGMTTVVIPPGTLTLHSTITGDVLVITTIFGGLWSGGSDFAKMHEE